MERYHPIDVDERATSWRQKGWTGFNADDDSVATTQTSQQRTGYGAASSNVARTTDPFATTPVNQASAGYATQNFDADNDDEATFEVVEEEVNVGKRQVERGGVRVHSRIEEVPVEKQVQLREERVNVQRHPVDRPANASDFQSFEEGTFEVTATAEEPVVEKRARVVEEVVIDKDVQERTHTVRETERRKEVAVEQVDGGDGYGSIDRFNSTFRNHWQSNYANSGYTWEQYEPAYRYGYTLANDQRYQGRDWNAIEADARRTWSQQHQDSPWENFKDAVRHGWQQVKQTVAG
jgi:stress response protein YsnF